MKNSIIAIICMLSGSLTGFANSDNEVTVKGSTIINKADRKLLIPTSEQIKNAQTGIQVLKNQNLVHHIGLVLIDLLTCSETLNGDKNIQVITLSYKNINFAAGIINPFIKNYNVPSENRNQYAGYTKEINS